MKKKIFGVLVLAMALLGSLMPATEVSAAVIRETPVDCAGELLGLRPWYKGLTTEINEKCEVGTPNTGCEPTATDCNYENASNAVASFIWVIILNVLVDLFVIAGLVAVGFMIYGGYLYLRSGGDVNFATRGRKTLTSAIIGLVIVTLANVISRIIVQAITAS